MLRNVNELQKVFYISGSEYHDGANQTEIVNYKYSCLTIVIVDYLQNVVLPLRVCVCVCVCVRVCVWCVQIWRIIMYVSARIREVLGLSHVRFKCPKKGRGGDYIGNGFRMVQTFIFEKRKIWKNEKKEKAEKSHFCQLSELATYFCVIWRLILVIG